MQHLGDFNTGATVRGAFNTRKSDGTPITLAGTPALSVYKDGNTTETTTGVTLTVDFDSRTGHHLFAIDTSDAFYSSGSDFRVVITTGTVDSISVVGAQVGSFSIANRSALRPTVAGRTLDVSSGGEAGIDFANIGSPTTTVNLSGTTVKAVTDNVTVGTNNDKTGYSLTQAFPSNFASLGINASGHVSRVVLADTTTAVTNSVTAGTVSDKTGYSLVATTGLGNQTCNITGNLSGSVGSVTGAVGSVTGNVGGSVASVTGAVGSVTGNVGGNVVGSVASVTAQVTANVTAISGDSVAADNCEAFFDGTGYAGTGNVIPVVTSVTNRVTANTDQISGSAVSTTIAQIGVNIVNAGGTAWGSGAITAASIASSAITDAKIATAAITSAKFAAGAIDSAAMDVNGSEFTNIPWNSAWDSEVQSEVQDAIEVNHLDHLLAATYDPASKPGAADALLNELVENDGGVARFTANALEQAPAGGGGAGDASQATLLLVKAKTDLITSTNVTYTSPVSPTGAIRTTIIIGDDYLAANARAFEWTISARTGVTVGTASCRFGGANEELNKSWLVTGTVSDLGGGQWKLSFDLDKTVTGALEEGYYRWSVELLSAGGTEITEVFSGRNVEVRKKQT